MLLTEVLLLISTINLLISINLIFVALSLTFVVCSTNKDFILIISLLKNFFNIGPLSAELINSFRINFCLIFKLSYLVLKFSNNTWYVNVRKSLSYDLNSANTVSLTLSVFTLLLDTCSNIVILLSITWLGFEGLSVPYISNNVYNEACAL